MTDTLIEARRPVGRLRQDGRRPRARPPRRRRRGRRPPRRERRRQDHDAAHPGRRAERRWRARSSSSATPTKAPMHVRCRNGLGYVTEERSVIMDMSVADNLKLAGVAARRWPSATSRRSSGRWTAAPGSARAASSRCCRWPGRSVASRRCSSPTSCRSAWRRSSSPTSSRPSATRPTERGVGVLLVEQHVRQALTHRRSRLRDGAGPDRAERHRRGGRAASSTGSRPPTSPAPADLLDSRGLRSVAGRGSGGSRRPRGSRRWRRRTARVRPPR